VSGPRSNYGRALDDVVERLGRSAEVAIDPSARAFLVFMEIATTPLMWPLDDVLYEFLLATAGFDLTDANDLHGALWATALLVAGDPSYNFSDGLRCGHDHDRASLFCALLRDTDLDADYCRVMDLADDGTFQFLERRRAQKCIELDIDDINPDALPDAA